MKTCLFLFAFLMTAIVPAQSQYFSDVVLANIQDRKVVCFTLPNETNVRYYRVEASNDSINYEIIGTLRSTGNSVLAKSYRYELHEPVYKYYRVGMVGMNASLMYSPVINVQKQDIPKIQVQNVPRGATIVNKQ